MPREICLEPNQVPATLKGSYTGRKFRAVVCESVTVPSTAGLWDGGSRDQFDMIRLADGAQVPFPGQEAAPWDSSRQSRIVLLRPGFGVVQSRMFRGVDMGLTFYLCPTDAAPMLPAPVDSLNPVQKLVLDYTAGRKSSYNGKDRYEMARDDSRYGYGYCQNMTREQFPSRPDWEAAKAELIESGYLDKRGAITPKGRNAAKSV